MTYNHASLLIGFLIGQKLSMLSIKVKHCIITMPLFSLSISNLKRMLKLIAHHLSPNTYLPQISIQIIGQGSLSIISPSFSHLYFTIFVKE
jgi:hypothetical protein